MRKGELISKSFGVALVFVMLASTLGAMAWAGGSNAMVAGSVDLPVEQAKATIDSDANVMALDVSAEGEYQAGPMADAESDSSLSSEIDASLDAGKPVFLFFHADWCHFCEKQMPIIEELELEYAERIVVIYVNNEDNPQAMTEFGVTGFPAMFLISSKGADGEYRYQEFNGFTGKETLSQSFDWVLKYGSVPGGAGANSDTRGEETIAAMAADFSQDLCIRALQSDGCPEHCECVTDEEAEERELTLCDDEPTECWYWDPALGDEVMGHCYQTEEEPTVCGDQNINLIRQHLESNEIKFIAVIDCPIAGLVMIVGGEEVEECDGNYCEYYGGPYQPGQVLDFAVTIFDDLHVGTTFDLVPAVDINDIPDGVLEFDPSLGLCNRCPAPQPGWGKLVGCTCEGSAEFQPWDRTSYVRITRCSYQNLILSQGPCFWGLGGQVGCEPITAPIYDHCVGDDLIVHLCQNGKCVVGTYTCPFGCSNGQCDCSDTDGGLNYYEWGEIPGPGGYADYCIDSTWLMEYSTQIGTGSYPCTIINKYKYCHYGCQAPGECAGSCYDGIQNGDEQGVDCGPSCPASCLNCFLEAGPGNAEDAGYFDLNSMVVSNTAWLALEEYADCLANRSYPNCRNTLHLDAYNLRMDFSTVTANDLAQSTDYIMEAVAYYVDKHTQYRVYDLPQLCPICDEDGAISAEDMILHSSEYMGGWPPCGKDYCGDCEDHAILREALMRVLGVSWKCAFCADHFATWGHTFNLVYYRNRWRIMDYHPLGEYFYDGSHTDLGDPHQVWNDEKGEFWCEDWEDDLGWCSQQDPYYWTQNYYGRPACHGGNPESYYLDWCP